MTKTAIKDTISQIKIDEKDMAGDQVIKVLSKSNEFVIYEIDSDNIQQRIRVFIDGHTDESEALIQNRFNKVKSSYIQAKGELFHSTNFEMNKQRVVNTLSTYLSSDEQLNKENGQYGQLFASLIQSIYEEQEKILKHRLLYISPVIIVTLVLICSLYFVRNERELIILSMSWYDVLTYLSSIFVGTCMSLLIKSKKFNFQESNRWLYYLLLGFERLILTVFLYLSAIILIKSEMILSPVLKDNSYSIMFFLLIVGFSESFIPSMLSKAESEFNQSK